MDKKNKSIAKISNDNDFSDIGSIMQKMQKMMTKMNDVENLNEEDAASALQEMLSEVENVTKTVEKQVSSIAKNIQDDPNVSDQDKNKYLGLTKNLGKLTSALKDVDSNPEKAEKTLNGLMGVLKKDMSSLTESEEDSDSVKIEDMDHRISKIERKLGKLEEIMKEIARRIPKKA
jgi:phage host-nuclease inhibitor protein Gam